MNNELIPPDAQPEVCVAGKSRFPEEVFAEVVSGNAMIRANGRDFSVMAGDRLAIKLTYAADVVCIPRTAFNQMKVEALAQSIQQSINAASAEFDKPVPCHFCGGCGSYKLGEGPVLKCAVCEGTGNIP